MWCGSLWWRSPPPPTFLLSVQQAVRMSPTHPLLSPRKPSFEQPFTLVKGRNNPPVRLRDSTSISAAVFAGSPSGSLQGSPPLLSFLLSLSAPAGSLEAPQRISSRLSSAVIVISRIHIRLRTSSLSPSPSSPRALYRSKAPSRSSRHQSAISTSSSTDDAAMHCEGLLGLLVFLRLILSPSRFSGSSLARFSESSLMVVSLGCFLPESECSSLPG